MSFNARDPIEYFLNAEINFENFAKMNPSVLNHPIFKIAQEQLKNGIQVLENKTNLSKDPAPIGGDSGPEL